MSKTFGQLKAGDKVYVINGSNVDIIRLSVAEPSPTDKNYTWVIFDDYEYSVYSDSTSFYDDMVGDIYCDIDDAMRKMQDICAKALHDYREASGALNLLEIKKKEDEKRGNKKDNNVSTQPKNVAFSKIPAN